MNLHLAAEDKGEVGDCFSAVFGSDARTDGETTGASFSSFAMTAGRMLGFRLDLFEVGHWGGVISHFGQGEGHFLTRVIYWGGQIALTWGK